MRNLGRMMVALKAICRKVVICVWIARISILISARTIVASIWEFLRYTYIICIRNEWPTYKSFQTVVWFLFIIFFSLHSLFCQKFTWNFHHQSRRLYLSIYLILSKFKDFQNCLWRFYFYFTSRHMLYF